MVRRQLGGTLDVVFQRLFVVNDFHTAAAQHVGRTNQYWVADGGSNLAGLSEGGGGAVFRCCQFCLVEDLAEFAAVLGGVDSCRAGAHDRNACLLQAGSKAQRSLATQLDNHASNVTRSGLRVVNLHDVLEGQRLEVETVCGVIVGGDGLRVAVDHDGLVALLRELKGRVNAGVVKLDTLTNAVRAGAQNDDLTLGAFRCRANLGLGIRVKLIGAVVVRGLCFEFAGTGIYGLVHGADTHAPAQATYAILAVEFGAKGGNLGVGKPKDLGLPQKLLGEHWGVDKLLAEGHQRSQLSDEPGINTGGLMYLIYRSAEAKGQLDVVHAALGWALQILEHRLQVGSPLSGEVLIRLGPKAVRLVFQRTHDLIEARDIVTADAHGLAHRLHGGSQGVIGTRELLKSKARGLDNDVVQGRLEGSLGLTGDVILHLVQGVADSELGRQLSNRETGGLGCQRGGTGHARVHLDDDDAAVIGVYRELDIAAASIDADLADDGNAQVTHLLELTVSEGQRRGDGDGIAGVHA